MKVALITGTSTGIGHAAAVAAVRAGYRTVATMRDPGKAGTLREAAPRVDVRRLDVVDDASVRACVEGVVADYGRLDAVVNNAGAGHVGTVEVDPVAAVREVMEVNYFGVVQVSKAAMPHLRAARGRLVTVTSVGGVVGQPFNEAYCAAKFAVEGMMESLAPVARRVGVTVSVVEPGAVATGFVAGVRGRRPAILSGGGPYAQILDAYLARTGGAYADAQTAEEAAAVVLRALTEAAPRFRYQTSEQAERFVAVKQSDTDGAAVQRLTSGWL